MNGRSITVLALITGIVLAIAVVATLVRRPGAAQGGETYLLPDFRAQLNDAASLAIRQGEQSVTLHQQDDRWTVKEKGDYPAKFQDIKALLLTLADLEGAEPKTARPELYDRIGVEDPAPGNDATLVTVADGGGAEILRLILGDNASTGSAPARFVRVGSEPQSWLVNASINAPADPLSWVDREIIRLSADLVSHVRAERDGETLAIVRESGGSFTVEGLPLDRVAKPAPELRRYAGALSFLSFTDLEPLDESAVPTDALLTTFTRTDGVGLPIRSWQEGEQRWITIGVTRPPAEDLTEEARLQADDYEQRFTGWRFALDEFRFEQLRPSVEDLSAPKPEEGPPDPGMQDGNPDN